MMFSIISFILKVFLGVFALVNLEKAHAFLPKKLQENLQEISWLKVNLNSTELAVVLGLGYFFLGSHMTALICFLFVGIKMYK